MGSNRGLVPITRAFLSSYYDKHPFPSISDYVFRLSQELHNLSNDIRNTSLPLPEGERLVLKEVESQPPHKIDQNMWKNREQIEEIIFLLESSNWPKSSWLINLVDDEVDDDSVPLEPVTRKEALQAATTLHNFLLQYENTTPQLLSAMMRFKDELNIHLKCTKKQLKKQSTPEDIELARVIKRLKEKCEGTLKVVESFQSKNSENVFNTVMTYMPQDFRGTLIRKQRERSERNKKAEVEALINSGGSIRDKYALLWQQQMERRRQLAELGSAAGVYKTVVKYLIGVPQVLLDFVRQINDDHGPMEEQRQCYGPPMYALTKMALNIRLFISLSWWRFEDVKLQKHQISILEEAVNVYTSELERFLDFTGEVFANSPFFVTAEEAGAIEAINSDDYKEASVPAGTTYEVSLEVESVNSYIAWDFSITQGKITMDIGFSIEYTNSSGHKTLILPYRRYDSDQGNFCTIMAGNYKLIWDNSFSTFFRKALRYKVDCIPPVVEP